MTLNVGGIDRALRIAVGIAALLFVLLSDSDMRWWGLAGFVPLLTGLLRWCPAYSLLGLNSCAKS